MRPSSGAPHTLTWCCCWTSLAPWDLRSTGALQHRPGLGWAHPALALWPLELCANRSPPLPPSLPHSLLFSYYYDVSTGKEVNLTEKELNTTKIDVAKEVVSGIAGLLSPNDTFSVVIYR